MVIWGRYFFHTVLTFSLYAGRTRSLAFLRTRRPGLQFIRAGALFGATGFMYTAITRMQLADASSIQFLAPVLVTAFSILVLGERVGPRRWMAVVFGFIGVLLVARPGSGVLGWTATRPGSLPPPVRGRPKCRHLSTEAAICGLFSRDLP